MDNSICQIDLDKVDVYEKDIPDQDVETCLKVLRSVRNMALGPNFDANTAVLLSHAHAILWNWWNEFRKRSKPMPALKSKPKTGLGKKLSGIKKSE